MLHFRLLSLVLLLTFTSCVTNKVTGRRSLVAIPDSIVNNLGSQGFAEVQKTHPESENAELRALVEKIAFRIAEASGEKLEWEVKLLVDPQANAYVFPGGKIVVNTGILPLCGDEASLAFVLGHEVGHAIARHGAERMTHTLLIQGGLAAAQLTMTDDEQKPQIMAALGAGAQVGVLLPFSRSHESESDSMGLIYMAKAGYDPSVAPELWERFAEGQQEPPEFMSTHPNSKNRAEAMRQQLPEAMKIYQANPVKIGIGVSFK